MFWPLYLVIEKFHVSVNINTGFQFVQIPFLFLLVKNLLGPFKFVCWSKFLKSYASSGIEFFFFLNIISTITNRIFCTLRILFYLSCNKILIIIMKNWFFSFNWENKNVTSLNFYEFPNVIANRNEKWKAWSEAIHFSFDVLRLFFWIWLISPLVFQIFFF